MKKSNFVNPVEREFRNLMGSYTPTLEELAECKRLLKELRDSLEESMRQEEKK